MLSEGFRSFQKTVYVKMKHLSSFTQPHVVSNPYDFFNAWNTKPVDFGRFFIQLQ